ncbi:hypothetical protein TorRG33x02_334000 [Trema orientale]|uniref:Uncharacterized protein n=1 Tax=Trema orientale TaxID=63057 RepID=A0A2P5B3J5_TREOI|nr:hypothetical protein TorRG33x02_334000 [Trema orientale]
MGCVGNFKHLDREFRVEHKVFLLSVVDWGQSIKLVERNRITDYHVTFDLGAAGWLCDILKEALVCPLNQRFFRKFRGNSYVLMVGILINRRGRFLEVSHLQSGVLKRIVVPGGFGNYKGRGWFELLDCLESMVRRNCKVEESRSRRNILEAGSIGGIGNFGNPSHFHGGRKNWREAGPHANKNWKLAIVVYRNNIKQLWNTIDKGFSRKLRREVHLTELFADRAILWCANSAEKRFILLHEQCYLFSSYPVRVVSWCQKHHWVDVKFAGRDTWVGVEGISLDWWNRIVFNDIGERLGGLIDVDRDTIDISFIRFAKLRVRGFRNGFLPTKVEMALGSDRMSLQVFPLDGAPISAPSVATRPVLRNSTAPVGKRVVLPRLEWRRVVTGCSVSDVAHFGNPNCKPKEKQLVGACSQHGNSATKMGEEAYVGLKPFEAVQVPRKNISSNYSKEIIAFEKAEEMVAPTACCFSDTLCCPSSSACGSHDKGKGVISPLSSQLDEDYPDFYNNRKWTRAHVADTAFLCDLNLAHSCVDDAGPSDVMVLESDVNERRIRAQSELFRPFKSWAQSTYYLKHLKPKQKETFVSGSIQRYEKSDTHKTKAKNQNSAVLRQYRVGVELSKTIPSPSALKVYSRSRNKRSSTMNCNETDKFLSPDNFNEMIEAEFGVQDQLAVGPDSSSDYSCSKTESDHSTSQEDVEAPEEYLEGIVTLFDETGTESISNQFYNLMPASISVAQPVLMLQYAKAEDQVIDTRGGTRATGGGTHHTRTHGDRTSSSTEKIRMSEVG